MTVLTPPPLKPRDEVEPPPLTVTRVAFARETLKRIRLALVSVSTALLMGCSHNGPTPAAPVMQTIGDIRASLATVPTEPHTGDDTLVVTLTDPSTNTSIGDANLTAQTVSLAPRLPGVPTTGRAQGNGIYNIPVRFAIASSYRVELQVQRVGRPPVTFTFPLNIGQ